MESLSPVPRASDGAAALASAVATLYPGREETVLAGLRRLMDGFRARGPAHPSRAERPSSEAILIAYPDMLRGDEAPLSLLSAFAEKRLKGRFSHLHILPFFPSSSDEGFSIMDFHSVEPRYGRWDDMTRMGRTLGLVFDLVLNHASVQGHWFQSFLRGEPPFDRFFVTRSENYDTAPVFRPRTHPLLTPFLRNGKAVSVWTTFSADQADLDFREPEVLWAMVEVALHLLRQGADILRLDAVAFAWKADGTNCLDRPEVHALVRLLRAVVEEAAPGTRLLSETNLPQSINDSYFGAGDEAQMVYRFALPPLALYAFVAGRADALCSWAAGLPEPRVDHTYVNFLSSHDGVGVTPARGILSARELDSLVAAVRARGGLVSERTTPEGPVPYELNTTFLDALVEPNAPEETRIRAFLSCHALMVALSGIPAVWFHSLVGSRHWSEGPRLTGSNRSIHRERLDAAALDLALDDPASLRSRVFRGLVSLLEARARRPAFRPDSPQRVLPPDEADPSVFALLRGTGAQAVLTLVNVADRPAHFRLPADFQPRGALFDPTEGGAPPPSLVGGEITLPPLATAWLEGDLSGA